MYLSKLAMAMASPPLPHRVYSTLHLGIAIAIGIGIPESHYLMTLSSTKRCHRDHDHLNNISRLVQCDSIRHSQPIFSSSKPRRRLELEESKFSEFRFSLRQFKLNDIDKLLISVNLLNANYNIIVICIKQFINL